MSIYIIKNHKYYEKIKKLYARFYLNKSCIKNFSLINPSFKKNILKIKNK